MNYAWNDYYTPEEIKKIQEIELKSLDVFIQICEKLDIKFYLYGGSLLGAIKYNGFIPWDDDLDIALLRSDYEKLLKEGPKLVPPNYELQHPTLNKKTPYHYTKFRRTDTQIVEYRNHKIKINHGVYFDIYPIDNIPDDYADLLKQKLKYDKWVYIFQIRQNYRTDLQQKSLKKSLRTIVRFIQSFCAHIFSCKYLLKKINKISTMYNDIETQQLGNLSFPKPKNYFNGVLPGININFSDRDLLIPCGYEVNLINRYGDYKKLPPESDRIGHKPYVLNLNLEDRRESNFNNIPPQNQI